MKIGLLGCGRFGKRIEERVSKEFNNIEDYLDSKLNVTVCGVGAGNDYEGFDQLVLVVDCSDYDGCSEAAQRSLFIDKNIVIADILGMASPFDEDDYEEIEIYSNALRQGSLPLAVITPDFPTFNDEAIMYSAVVDLIMYRLIFLDLCNPEGEEWLEDIRAIRRVTEALGLD